MKVNLVKVSSGFCNVPDRVFVESKDGQWPDLCNVTTPVERYAIELPEDGALKVGKSVMDETYIYYNTSACDISISSGKAVLECYEDGRFHKFSIKIL